MKRNEFIKKAAFMAALSMPVLTLVSSCSKDEIPEPPAPSQTDCLANGTNSSIGSNHGHSLTVSKDDVQIGVQKSYSIGGGAGHDHDVTISANHFADLKNNQSIQVDSTSGSGHTHTISVSCA